MSEPKRLHPITAVINFFKQLREALLPLVVLFFANRGGDSVLWQLLPLILVAFFVLAAGIIKWLRFTYRVEDGELRIEHGLFVKKKRYIPFERIQSLNYSEGIFHRPFKLVKIKVETASSGSNESEAELTAITKEEAASLNKLIAQAKKKAKAPVQEIVYDEEGNEIPAAEPLVAEEAEIEEVPPEERIVYKMKWRDLVVMATTSGGIGVVLSAVLIFLSQFSELIPYETVVDEVTQYVRAGIWLTLIFVFFVLFLAWLIAVVMTVFRYAYFTVKIVEKDLVITRGLLEKKQTTVPLNRIQGIRFSQNLLREPLRYTTVSIESAGGSVLEGDSNTIRLLPMIRTAETERILKDVLPEYTWEASFASPPKRSIFRYMFWKLLFISFAVAPVSYFFYPYGLLSLLVYPVVALYGYWQYRTAGVHVAGDQLVMRHRHFLKETVYMKKKRVQTSSVTQTWFQRKGNVATVFATIKSSSASNTTAVEHLDLSDAEAVLGWYSPETDSAAMEEKLHDPS